MIFQERWYFDEKATICVCGNRPFNRGSNRLRKR